ncbi:hypothetical protein Q1695_007151 [Nippostrongylus brasiliensis]|nr:hypothetical protein Q1695_007151 [Nippostrongylus brasiliensis]
MNTLSFAAILLFSTAVVLVEARAVERRQAGSNTYGDEPSLPPTVAPYEAGAETTAAPPEEEPAPVVENVAPVAAPEVVDSGYRAKRQAGSNTYGDELTVPAQAAVEPVEKAPEVAPEPVVVEAMPGPAPEVAQSGYKI